MAPLWMNKYKETRMAQIKAQTKLHLLMDQKKPIPLEVFLQIADEEGSEVAWSAYEWTRNFYRS